MKEGKSCKAHRRTAVRKIYPPPLEKSTNTPPPKKSTRIFKKFVFDESKVAFDFHSCCVAKGAEDVLMRHATFSKVSRESYALSYSSLCPL
jgi:hypothetical protein